MVVIIHLLSTMDIPQNTTAFRERKYAANVEKLRWRRWEPSMLSSACPRWQGGKQNIVGGCLFFPVGGAFCYYFLRILGFWRNLGGKISCFIWQYMHIFFSTWVVKKTPSTLESVDRGFLWCWKAFLKRTYTFRFLSLLPYKKEALKIDWTTNRKGPRKGEAVCKRCFCFFCLSRFVRSFFPLSSRDAKKWLHQDEQGKPM